MATYEAVAARVAEASNRRQTALVVARSGILAGNVLAAGARIGGRLAWNAIARRREAPLDVAMRVVAELLQELGPTYVKLGQILSVRRDLLGETAVRHLERLQDDLPPGPFGIVSELFRSELGTDAGDVLSALDAEPIGSASVATVYRGRLRDGRAVAVKIRRPAVVRRVRADLGVLRAGATALSKAPPTRLLPIRAVVDDLGACIERQLDFRREAASNRRLRQALADHTAVVIPKLVDGLCSESILTMDLVEEVGRGTAARAHGNRDALLAALRALYAMVFVEGFVHCDLHPGNLHLLPDGRAVILDFGLIAELNDHDRKQFAEFFLAVASNDGATCARIAVEMATACSPRFDQRAFAADVSAVVSRASGATAGEFRVADFVGRLFDLQRRHGVYSTPAFALAILSLLVFEGIAKEVDPDLDFQREAVPFVLRALA